MRWLIIVMFLLFTPFLLFSAGQWWAARGVRVAETACAWSQEDLYVARIALRNENPVFKLVSLRIQGRFRPSKGQRWPTPSVKSSYSSMSQWTVVELQPSETLQQEIPFRVPGAEGFVCEADAWVGKQERFVRQPSPEVIDAIKRTLR